MFWGLHEQSDLLCSISYLHTCTSVDTFAFSWGIWQAMHSSTCVCVPAPPVAVLRCDAQECSTLATLGALYTMFPWASFDLLSATCSKQGPKCLSQRTSMDRNCLGDDLNVDFLHCYLLEVIILVCVVILCTGMCGDFCVQPTGQT